MKCFLPLALVLACASAMAFPPPLRAVRHAPACSFQQPSTGTFLDSVRCKADPSQTYAVYIPPHSVKGSFPVVYFFDSHGVGALPLKKYKALADAFGFIFIGSNNSRNGNDWPTEENIWNRMFQDSRTRWSLNLSRVYLCGFSGGAKAAGYVAIQTGLPKGIIANGAGLPDGVQAADVPFSFTAVAGEGDMNLTDLVAFTQALDATKTRHRILFFDGKHEWAPASTMRQAMAGWELDAMRDGLLPKDNAMINRYAADSKKRVEAATNARAWIKAVRECQLSAGLLQALSPEVEWFSERASALAAQGGYQQQLRDQGALLAKEQQIKEGYMDHFQQGDMSYWTTTIRDLQRKASVDNAEKSMNQRLLAYLSLAFYSFSNQLINGRKDEAAGHFVTLYKLADPTNSEAWYFSAVLHARSGDAAGTETDLERAVACGFRDWGRMAAQPEFSRVRVNIAAIEKGAH